MDIGHVIDEQIPHETLQRSKQLYFDELATGEVSSICKFNYAHALLRSNKKDIKTGIALLEEFLEKNDDEIPKRDIIYFMAIGYTRLTDYDRAMVYVDLLLSAEENNRQALDLKNCIEKRMRNSGLWGAAIIGAGVLGIAGLTLSAVLSGRK
uniref:Mitochondrial fission 1 protein n=1 Tax=Strongyloides stercoralis TaxID=6248 RepID=A0A0K0ERX4_STRER